jgi:hypothetical protein
MVTPPEQVKIECPNCGHTYETWYRAAINVKLEDLSEEEVEDASFGICPECRHKVDIDSLISDTSGTFVFNEDPDEKETCGERYSEDEDYDDDNDDDDDEYEDAEVEYGDDNDDEDDDDEDDDDYGYDEGDDDDDDEEDE